MNEAQLIGRLALFTQLGTALYALRLNRRFGVQQAGWALFGAFTLMLMMQVNQAWEAMGGFSNPGLKPEVAEFMASVLLLIGMFHVGVLFHERHRMAQAVRRQQAECDERIEAQASAFQRRID